MKRAFEFTSRIRSFEYAGLGLWTMLRSQRNAWIHAVATVGVCAAGLCFRISRTEWCFIVLAMMAVWAAEALNTAFEFLADATTPEFHPLVQKSKDVAAGAVLLSAIGSVIIGLLVFVPYVLK